MVPLVEHHLAHTSIGMEVTAAPCGRGPPVRLAPLSIAQLIRLIEADESGRPPMAPGLPENAARLRDMAAMQSVEEKPQAPFNWARTCSRIFKIAPGNILAR